MRDLDFYNLVEKVEAISERVQALEGVMNFQATLYVGVAMPDRTQVPSTFQALGIMYDAVDRVKVALGEPYKESLLELQYHYESVDEARSAAAKVRELNVPGTSTEVVVGPRS
jgi:hypothetical protein